jgi:hypothetical protein
MHRGTGLIGGELQTLESAGRLRLQVFVIPDLPQALSQLCSDKPLTFVTELPKDRSAWWRNHNLRTMMSSIGAKHADRLDILFVDSGYRTQASTRTRDRDARHEAAEVSTFP